MYTVSHRMITYDNIILYTKYTDEACVTTRIDERVFKNPKEMSSLVSKPLFRQSHNISASRYPCMHLV